MSEFDIKVTGLNELIHKLGNATAQETLEEPLYQGALLLQAWSQKNRLTGPRPKFLGVQTGRLRSSITTSRSIKRSEFSFFIGTNVSYARIQEYGGTIRPGAKGFLAWRSPRTGKYIFTKKPVVIPARPFLGPAIQDEQNHRDIMTLLQKSVNQALTFGGA